MKLIIPKFILCDFIFQSGSTFTKAKPQVPWTRITQRAVLRVMFFPLYYKWWVFFHIYFHDTTHFTLSSSLDKVTSFIILYSKQCMGWQCTLNNFKVFQAFVLSNFVVFKSYSRPVTSWCLSGLYLLLDLLYLSSIHSILKYLL